MGWDRHELLWDGMGWDGTKKNVPWTSLGIPAEDSAKLRAWLSGPEFLLDWNARTHWEEPTTLKNVPPAFLPVRKQKNFTCLKVKNEIAFDRFSTLYKLKQVIALVFRYKTILLCRIRKQKAAFPKKCFS